MPKAIADLCVIFAVVLVVVLIVTFLAIRQHKKFMRENHPHKCTVSGRPFIFKNIESGHWYLYGHDYMLPVKFCPLCGEELK